ncbi:MAG TPA: DUF2188 domain-containing protein [Marmoricola sp.]|jgi:hypothetical protein|nr:DUF2188 domain-containing protein [Marmoricola sp.]
MSAANIETYFENGQWKNWDQAERSDIGSAHASRDDAVDEGRQLARERNVEHVVRDEDAKIVDREEHGETDAPSPEDLRELKEEAFESRFGAPEPVEER